MRPWGLPVGLWDRGRTCGALPPELWSSLPF